MAFRDFSGAGAKLPEPSAERATAPAMMPLSLELVPPSLSHSFGVALSDAQSLHQTALGLGARPLTELDFRFRAHEAYGASCLSAAQQMHAYSMGMFGAFGQLQHMGLDPQAYAAQANRMLQLAGNGALGGPHGRLDSHGAATSQAAAYYGAGFGTEAPGARHSEQPRLEAGMQSNPLGVSYGHASCLQPQDAERRSQPAGCGDTARGVKRPMDGAPDAPTAPATQSMEPIKRSRLVWTRELHQRFEQAVDKAGGIDVAVPKSVLEHMSVPGLTRDNVASHLQKHRMHRKRDKEAGAAASVCLSRGTAITASDTLGHVVQRSSTDIQDATHTSAAHDAPDAAAATGGDAAAAAGKGFATASMCTTHNTSDSGSRRTAFVALRSHGQYSTPDSRDTAAAGEGAPGMMASSIRHGSGGADALLTAAAAAAAAARGDDDTETGAAGGIGGGSGSGGVSQVPPDTLCGKGGTVPAERPTLADCRS